MNQLILNALFIASAGMIWKNLQKDFSAIGKFIHSLPWILMKPIHCSFCFIYWFTLAFILFQNNHLSFYQIIYGWFVLGFISYLFYTVGRILYFTMELQYEKWNVIPK